MNDVWVIDDDSSIRWVLGKALQQARIPMRAFENANDVPALLAHQRPSVIVTDIRMPGLSGLALLERIRERIPALPVIVMTAHSDLDSAVSSYRSGAFEYLPKPFDVDEAVRLIRRAIDHAEADAGSPPQEIAATEIVGEAPAMQDVFRAIGRLANSNMSVLISGESGTGKELVARALYRHSPRAASPFIPINTAAIPAELLESELFGHEKGAFTGAVAQRKGRFEQAHEGTLFLDEIGDMPPSLQTRLLRVLSDGCFYRVGGHEQLKVDVRIIAATNQDIEAGVAQGRFREDLYHRLNVIRIRHPALRERSEDIPRLTQHFLEAAARELDVGPKQLEPETLRYLCRYSWPGNVRQLENVCRWLTVMAPGQSVSPSDLPEEIRADTHDAAAGAEWERLLCGVVEQRLADGDCDILASLGRRFERVLLDAALRHTGGHKQEAARRLGWGRNTLARKLKELQAG